MPNRRLIALLAATAAGVVTAAPAADAAWTTIGSDLTPPATIAHGDPNDFVMWPSATPGATIDVPVDGQAIIMRMKGGSVSTAEQHERAEAIDPAFDIFHFLVLSPRDGTWVTTASSQDLEARRVGDDATPDTVATYKSGPNNPLCVKRGDRIAVASIGGYVPGVFDRGLPLQVFGSRPGAASFGYEHGGNGPIQMDGAPAPTVVHPSFTYDDEELLLQVVIGTGPNARYSCGGSAPTLTGGTFTEAGDLPELPDPAPGSAGSVGATGTRVKPAMATPASTRRRLGRQRRARVTLTCRPDGAPCTGTIELRVHKQRIGLARYGRLQPGETGTFTVRLSRKGAYYVRADSDRRMLTSVVVTSTDGRRAGGKLSILPRRR